MPSLNDLGWKPTVKEPPAHVRNMDRSNEVSGEVGNFTAPGKPARPALDHAKINDAWALAAYMIAQHLDQIGDDEWRPNYLLTPEKLAGISVKAVTDLANVAIDLRTGKWTSLETGQPLPVGSFKIIWHDTNTGADGNGIISLFSHIMAIDHNEAAYRLAKFYAIENETSLDYFLKGVE